MPRYNSQELNTFKQEAYRKTTVISSFWQHPNGDIYEITSLVHDAEDPSQIRVLYRAAGERGWDNIIFDHLLDRFLTTFDPVDKVETWQKVNRDCIAEQSTVSVGATGNTARFTATPTVGRVEISGNGLSRQITD